jgi:hypothetical protein
MKALMRRAQAQEKLENFQDAITGIVWFLEKATLWKIWKWCMMQRSLLLSTIDHASMNLVWLHSWEALYWLGILIQIYVMTTPICDWT